MKRERRGKKSPEDMVERVEPTGLTCPPEDRPPSKNVPPIWTVPPTYSPEDLPSTPPPSHLRSQDRVLLDEHAPYETVSPLDHAPYENRAPPEDHATEIALCEGANVSPTNFFD